MVAVPTPRSTRSTRQAAACIGLVLATPVAAWWLMDLLAEDLDDPDYFIRPLEIDPTLKLVIGITAVALAVGAVLELAVFEPARSLVERWWSVMCPLLIVGMISGGGWAILTAPSIGANIGAGVFLLTAPPVVLALVIWAGVSSYRVLRRPPQAADLGGALDGR